jgi:hypothetical protein
MFTNIVNETPLTDGRLDLDIFKVDK